MNAVLWRRTCYGLLAALLVVVLGLVVGLVRREPMRALVELPVELQARPDQFRDLGVFRDGQLSAPPVASTATGYSAEGVQHGAEFRDQAWLRAQEPATYTLQVLGARDEEAVKAFIAARADKSQLRYFQTRLEGQPWFVVIYGSFSSRELALGVAGSLDFGVDSRPFPKSFGAIQDELARQEDQLGGEAVGVEEAPEDVVPPGPEAVVVPSDDTEVVVPAVP